MSRIENADGFKYPRSVRKVLNYLESKSLMIDPYTVTETEIDRIAKAKQYLNSRGVPQERIDENTIPLTSNPVYVNKPDTWSMEPADRVMFTAIMDAALSGKTVVINDIEETVKNGYEPNSSKIGLISPTPGYRFPTD